MIMGVSRYPPANSHHFHQGQSGVLTRLPKKSAWKVKGLHKPVRNKKAHTDTTG